MSRARRLGWWGRRSFCLRQRFRWWRVLPRLQAAGYYRLEAGGNLWPGIPREEQGAG